MARTSNGLWRGRRTNLRRRLPIPNQGAIFVGSSSAPQRTHSVRLRRLNPRRLDFILDLKLELFLFAGIDAGDAEGQLMDVDVPEARLGNHAGEFLVGGELQHRVGQVLVGVVA